MSQSQFPSMVGGGQVGRDARKGSGREHNGWGRRARARQMCGGVAEQ